MNAGLLPSRAVLRVAGQEARGFLQGLISNDMARVAPDALVYAMLLTPQGKVAHDFFVTEADGGFLIDIDVAQAQALLKKLKLYRLRAKVELEDVSAAWDVGAVFDGEGPLGALPDPRLAPLGSRVIAPKGGLGWPEMEAAYDRHRLSLGVPDHRDFDPEGTFLLDGNGEELHAVDFRKGCYVGQELTARMKHRGTARKRIVPVTVSADTPPGTPLLDQDGAQVGEIRSSREGLAMAAVRLDRLQGATALTAGGSPVTRRPAAYPLIA